MFLGWMNYDANSQNTTVLIYAKYLIDSTATAGTVNDYWAGGKE
jgi:hypothetical protein